MKLIHDCVRDVMLYVEDNLLLGGSLEVEDLESSLIKYSPQDIQYACIKLNEAGYLKIKPALGFIIITSMTYQGHLFLDNIRDNKVWSTTKKMTSRFASVSLDILQNIASQVITNIIQSNMK